jgi:hypothetical protein
MATLQAAEGEGRRTVRKDRWKKEGQLGESRQSIYFQDYCTSNTRTAPGTQQAHKEWKTYIFSLQPK